MAEGCTASQDNKRQRQQSGVGGENAGREIVVNEVLCYTLKKMGQLPEKTLKQILLDFYNIDKIVEAKDQLADNMADWNLLNWSRPRRRNNSKEQPSAKIRGEIDDIISMLSYIDQNLLSPRLPLYVAADPDALPSAKLTEGDLQCLLLKLNDLTDKVVTIGDSISKSDQTISGLATALTATSTAAPAPASTMRQLGDPDANSSNNNIPATAATATAASYDEWDNDPSVQTVSRKETNHHPRNVRLPPDSAAPSHSNVLATGRAEPEATGSNQRPSTFQPGNNRRAMLGTAQS